jgi:hypothetical protein
LAAQAARRIDVDATATDALEALLECGVSRLVVTARGSGMPRGVIGAIDSWTARSR